MRIVEIFIKEPCTSWNPYNWENIGNIWYDSLKDLFEDFANHGQYDFQKFKILRSSSKRFVGRYIREYEVDMKTLDQLNRPEVNQAEYKAIIIITEV